MTHRFALPAALLLVFGLASGTAAKEFWVEPEPGVAREDIHSRFSELARDAAERILVSRTTD